jgi:hypothetical protein
VTVRYNWFDLVLGVAVVVLLMPLLIHLVELLLEWLAIS